MNDEEKDVYIKGKIKDGHIPERIDDLFNNSIKIIENKGEKTMEENFNMNQNNQNKPEKKKMPVALKRVLATATCLTLLLGGGNIYASTQGYDNIFFMIKYMITGQEVSGKENILSDRDITISYKTIEIAKGTQIQVNSLLIKDNETKLKIHVDEKNAKEIITPLTYKVRDEKNVELCNYTSTHSQTHTDFKEELVLNDYNMEWKEKFLKVGGEGVNYKHENFHWSGTEQVSSHKFNDKEQLVSGMKITASINNYDIVKELGEENIKKTVGDEFRKWAKSLTANDWEYDDWFNGDLSDENIEKELNEYLEGYISEINSNYGRVDYSTDFPIYVDNKVKVFAKDLKEYDGTTLQYIGIMPTNEELDSYVKSIDETKINNIINNLKDLRTENFKDRVVTKITGYIPKFKFEYELNLKEDLQQLGITDVFEQGKANLTEICEDEEVYIEDAVHKANIEFTQDGIKAAAATIFGGAGAGSSFDYIYDIPVEEIDLTFDNPYMFLIRDKETGEIWFMGTVYEPLSWEEEPEKDNAY